ncbi:hypothetical protein [Allocoleopsis franciscana]|nr:hypothetical protein [Allocoleopsis franciscana]
MKDHSLVSNLIGDIKADSCRDRVSVSEALARALRRPADRSSLGNL